MFDNYQIINFGPRKYSSNGDHSCIALLYKNSYEELLTTRYGAYSSLIVFAFWPGEAREKGGTTDGVNKF